MPIRTTQKTMIFRHPFLMQYFDQALPAGSYEVVTEEESLEGLTFLAYRRLQTYIYRQSPPPRTGLAPTYVVDPEDLATAFLRDGNGDNAPETVASPVNDSLPSEFDRASDDVISVGTKP